MYQIYFTSKMKKDVKRMQKRGKDISRLTAVLDIMASGKSLPARNKDHGLTGSLSDFRECHIEPDWLLIYRLEDDALILTATETGTHADLLGL